MSDAITTALFDEVGFDRLPAPEETAVEAAAKAAVNGMPDVLRSLYAVTNGGYLGVIDVFTVADFADVNAQREYFAELPSAVLFGSDGGLGWFFLDGDAVGFVPRGAMTAGRIVSCAPSLVAFLRAVAGGQRPWEGADAEEVARNRMFAALEDALDAWTGREPPTTLELLAARRPTGVAWPVPLGKLMQRTNGLRIPGAEVELWPCQQVQAIPEWQVHDRPAALWIGSVGADRLAVMVNEAAGFARHDLVRVAAGETLDRGESLGYFPEVIVRWLREKSGWSSRAQSSSSLTSE